MEKVKENQTKAFCLDLDHVINLMLLPAELLHLLFRCM